MKTRMLAISLLVMVMAQSCFLTSHSAEKNKLVEIRTTHGTLKVELFNETPLHRDNFLKLVEEGFYDSLLFHRVIKEFMVQGGDPDSRGAAADARLGGGGPGYTVPAEIVEGLFHRKGALAAARQGDQVNPRRESSGSQFYIVHGKVFSTDELDQMSQGQNQSRLNQAIMAYMGEHPEASQKVRQLQMAGDQNALNAFAKELETLCQSQFEALGGTFTFSEAQRDAYASVGGAPHLDGAYTIFGQVIEGLEVVDSIANSATQPGDRPVRDVVILGMKVVRK